jgi:hypothetical protein
VNACDDCVLATGDLAGARSRHRLRRPASTLATPPPGPEPRRLTSPDRFAIAAGHLRPRASGTQPKWLNVLIIRMAPGPMMTMNKAGKMHSNIGNKILIGTF